LDSQRKYLSPVPEESVLKEGCLSGNCSEEIGRYYFSTQEAIYQGTFRGGLPHGRGVCRYANGEKYVGEWRRGYFNGKGVLILKDGTSIRGIWLDGRLVKTLHGGQFKAKDTTGDSLSADGEVYAVVIGISNYPELPALKYADDDAYRMYAHLRSPEGGAVPEEHFELLIDDRANKSNIESALKSVARKAGPSDRIVIFYSGHGLQDAFLPYDSDGFRQILTHNYIQKTLSESDCRSKIIFADACLSRQGIRDDDRWKAPSSLLEIGDGGTIVLLSSRMSETSLESDGLRQGVFSYFLFRGMSGAADVDMDQQITIGELYRFVSRHVVEYTSGMQHPMLGGYIKDALVIAQK
jgi:hypothetical protein